MGADPIVEDLDVNCSVRHLRVLYWLNDGGDMQVAPRYATTHSQTPREIPQWARICLVRRATPQDKVPFDGAALVAADFCGCGTLDVKAVVHRQSIQVSDGMSVAP